MKNYFRVSLSLILAGILLLFSFPKASASTYSYSEEYKSSVYYQRLINVKRTGNPCDDFVNIALSQVGYYEGSYSGSIKAKNGRTEYGRRFNIQDSWCAMFVSWCAMEAGVYQSAVGKLIGVPYDAYATSRTYAGAKGYGVYHSVISEFRGSSGIKYPAAESPLYVPQKGDIFVTKGHTGIVTENFDAQANKASVVEGNWGHAVVSSRKITLKNGQYYVGNDIVCAFLTPDFCQHNTDCSLLDNTGYCTQCGMSYDWASKNYIETYGTAKYVYGLLKMTIRERPYGESTKLATAKSVQVIGKLTNHLGETWYEIQYENGTAFVKDYYISFTPDPVTLTISGQTLPQNQVRGKNFGIRGTVSAIGGTLTRVYGAILDSKGNVVQSSECFPNSSTTELQSSINNDLIFGKLTDGTYRYVLKATAVNGSETVERLLINQSFVVGNGSSVTNTTVSKKPSLSISGQNAPTTITQGSNFGLKGTVKTDCGIITSLYGAILDTQGNVVQSGQYAPNQSSNNLRNSINNDLLFGKLSAGDYVYRVQATAKNGSLETTTTLIEQAFRVEAKAGTTTSPTTTPTPTTSSSGTTSQDKKPTLKVSGENYPGSLKQGSNFGIRGTVSTDCGVITRVFGAITDIEGNNLQHCEYVVNKSSVDLRYTINNDLIFGDLAAGDYVYFVDVTATNGTETTEESVIACDFRVYAPEQQPTATTPPATEAARTPTLTISGENYPNAQKIGKNFGIYGTVYTDYGSITELYGALYDSGGNVVQSGCYNPYSASVDLNTTVNNDLIFGRLGAGTYTYYLQATADNNGQQTTSVLINHSFTVGATASSNQPEPELNPVGYNMTVNVGAGSTLRFCSTVSRADQYELGSIGNGKTVYVYGTTKEQYEGRTWAKISFNGTDGWVASKWLK